MKKYVILSLLSLSLGVSMTSLCAQEVSDTGNGDGGYWDFSYEDYNPDGDAGEQGKSGQNDQQFDAFGAIEEPSPFDGCYEFWPAEDEFADVPAEPEDPATTVKRFVDSVFKQVANTNPLIEFMKQIWPISINNLDPAESERRAKSEEHMGKFVALLKQCPNWVSKPVKVDDDRWSQEEETLLSFAIGSAVPTAVLKAICDAGARIEQKHVDHAYIWSNVQDKPHFAAVCKFINQRFDEQQAQEHSSMN